MPIIQVENLSKTFFPGIGHAPVQALKNLTMEVAPHEVFGFLGPNGAGKTTTIKMITGLITPTQGKAWLFDQPAGRSVVHQKLGYLPEGPYFYDYLTIINIKSPILKFILFKYFH